MDQVAELGLVIPHFERPIAIYLSDNVQLRLAISDLYSDYLKFFIRLIRIISDEHSTRSRVIELGSRLMLDRLKVSEQSCFLERGQKVTPRDQEYCPDSQPNF